MKWAVAYYEGSLPLVWRDSEHFAWDDLPVDGVVWVDVTRNGQTMRLSGFDNYWVHDLRFGLFNDPENWAWYSGAQSLAFDWSGHDPVVLALTPPTAGARVLAGVLVPDEVAWELGLMPEGERLPPRPS